MVNPVYIPNDRRLPAMLRDIQRGVKDVQSPTGTEKNRTLMKLEEAVTELQEQQAEILAQSVHVFQAAPIQVTVNTPGLFPTFTRAISFPPPVGGGRVATLSLSAEFVRTSASGNVTIWVELLQNGISTWKRSGAFFVGDTASAPAAWGNPSINEPMQIEVPTALAAGMTVRLHAHTFVAETVSARMQNIIATLSYGARL